MSMQSQLGPFVVVDTQIKHSFDNTSVLWHGDIVVYIEKDFFWWEGGGITVHPETGVWHHVPQTDVMKWRVGDGFLT